MPGILRDQEREEMRERRENERDRNFFSLCMFDPRVDWSSLTRIIKGERTSDQRPLMLKTKIVIFHDLDEVRG